jgi:putative acetyltransferase
VPQLSLVAVAGGAIVGHVLCTRAVVDDEHAVVGLAPIGVRPSLQGRGIGHALMYAVLGAADALGFPLVGLVGAPEYYGRFGFEPATRLGIEPPDPTWAEHFQVRTLAAFPPGIRGVFRYAAPFNQV